MLYFLVILSTSQRSMSLSPSISPVSSFATTQKWYIVPPSSTSSYRRVSIARLYYPLEEAVFGGRQGECFWWKGYTLQFCEAFSLLRSRGHYIYCTVYLFSFASLSPPPFLFPLPFLTIADFTRNGGLCGLHKALMRYTRVIADSSARSHLPTTRPDVRGILHFKPEPHLIFDRDSWAVAAMPKRDFIEQQTPPWVLYTDYSWIVGQNNSKLNFALSIIMIKAFGGTEGVYAKILKFSNNDQNFEIFANFEILTYISLR